MVFYSGQSTLLFALFLTTALSFERERHLDDEPLSSLIELLSTNRRCNSECRFCLGSQVSQSSIHTLVKVRGESARRTRYWYTSPPKANLRIFLCWGRMDMWKYVSFRSIVTNQSLDLIWDMDYLIVSILKLSRMTEWFNKCRSRIRPNPPSFFGMIKNRL